MIKGLDSAFPPTLAQAEAAFKAGVRVWGGYFDGRGIYNGWTDEEIRRVQSAGHRVIAYCSGWSSPADVKAHAARLGVLACLDVEAGIRGDGSWVQWWLDASGAGLYGNPPVHRGRKAPFYVLAGQPGGPDPRATWHYAPPVYSVPKPPAPTGWQWRGTHTEYGVSVDSCWFDDWFGGDDMTPDEVRGIVNGYMSGFENGVAERKAGNPKPDPAHAPAAAKGWQVADDLLSGIAPGGPHHHLTGDPIV